MNNYLIVDTLVKPGIRYTPTIRMIVCEVTLKNENNNYIYYSLTDLDEYISLYESDYSLISELTNEDYPCFEKFYDKIRKSNLVICGIYEEILDIVGSNIEPIISYLNFFVKNYEKDSFEYIPDTIGKNINEVELPTI